MNLFARIPAMHCYYNHFWHAGKGLLTGMLTVSEKKSKLSEGASAILLTLLYTSMTITEMTNTWALFCSRICTRKNRNET